MQRILRYSRSLYGEWVDKQTKQTLLMRIVQTKRMYTRNEHVHIWAFCVSIDENRLYWPKRELMRAHVMRLPLWVHL